MFFVKLLRFLRGTVLFKLTGGFSERFINLCGQESAVVTGFITSIEFLT